MAEGTLTPYMLDNSNSNFASTDAYSLLGIARNATIHQIQAAYEVKTVEHWTSDETLWVARECLVNPFHRLLYDTRAGKEEPRSRSPQPTNNDDSDDDTKKAKPKAVKKSKNERKGRWVNFAADKTKEKLRRAKFTNETTLNRLNKVLDIALKPR